jgi:hypothetical protein
MSLYRVDLSSHRLSINIQSPLYLLRARSMRAMHDNNYIQHVEEEYKLRPTKAGANYNNLQSTYNTNNNKYIYSLTVSALAGIPSSGIWGRPHR